MPSSPEHREKADRNRAFLRTLTGPSSPEWVAIAAFYTALHLVERLSACDSLHHNNHQDRLAYLVKHGKHRAIHADFLTLFDASMIARYGTVNQFEKAFPEDTVEKELIGKRLRGIDKHVVAHFLSPPASATP